MWARRIPAEELAELRRVAPIWWNAKPPGSDGFPDDGFWVVTRHADVKEVSRRSEVFSNAENTALPRYGVPLTPERMQMQRLVLLNQDAPQHTRMRKLISKGFTPRAVNGLRAQLAARAEAIVAAARAAGAGDFVTQVACELPLQAIADLIGVPQQDRMKIFRWSNEMIGYDDPEYAGADPMAASAELLSYAWQMPRRERPTRPPTSSPNSCTPISTESP